MADFSDLVLRQTDTGLLLVCDGGKQYYELPGALQAFTPPIPTITTADELKTALAAGGNYNIAAGTYTGNFVATATPFQVTTIRCADGVVLQPSDVSKPTLQVSSGAFEWRGGTILGGINDTVIVGSNTATDILEQPSGVTFYSVTVTAPAAGAHRGFALHGENVSLVNCKVLGYYRLNQEAQAVWVNNGPGPYTFVDCTFEGAGENLLVGGDAINISGCVPSDITIRHCVFSKRPEWKANPAITVKNSLELKNAQRVLIEHCLFDGCWKGGQAGSPIVFTVRNSKNQSPWVIVDHVTFRRNIVRNCPDYYGVNILGHDDGGRQSEQTKNVTIEDNLFEHSPSGVQVNAGVTENLTIRRNTFPAIKDTLLGFANGTTKTNLHLVENTGKTGIYCLIMSGGTGKGTPALTDACSSYEMTGNVLERSQYKNSAGTVITASMPLPVGNTLLAPGTLPLDANDVLSGIAAGWSGPDGVASAGE